MAFENSRRGSFSGLAGRKNRIVPACCAGGLLLAAHGGARADVNSAALRALDPTLTGAGVRVAQVEAPNTTPNPPDFEVNPAFVNQPATLFTWSSTAQVNAGTFPNSAGTESSHADTVGNFFYGGNGAGVAPGVSRVDNLEANYFVGRFVFSGTGQVNVPAMVINQSFVTSTQGTQNAGQDAAYDNYVANFNKVIVSGAGNVGQPTSPSTAYNLISVGAFGAGAATAVGPTADGRSKPDIVAPAGETSYSTPQVAGAAAILIQAGLRNDGGAGTAPAATNSVTIKALLLNGADKPADWAHTQTAPLDPRYGAGNANVLNSYQQLRGGKNTFTTPTTTSLNGAHAPPAGTAGNVPSPLGWDNNTITSGTTTDAVNHYFFSLTGSPTYTLTATLDWNRQLNQTSINNLDLFLYNAATGALIDQSISGVDNVEHLFDQLLPAGRYDLQVLKHGGTPLVTAGDVSNSETYALAFSYAATPEPSSAMLLLGGVAAGMLRRRRKATGGDAERRR